MNGMQLRGQWNQVRGECRRRWCRMTGDNYGRMSGGMLKMFGKAQVRYGRIQKTAGRGLRKLSFH